MGPTRSDHRPNPTPTFSLRGLSTWLGVIATVLCLCRSSGKWSLPRYRGPQVHFPRRNPVWVIIPGREAHPCLSGRHIWKFGDLVGKRWWEYILSISTYYKHIHNTIQKTNKFSWEFVIFLALSEILWGRLSSYFVLKFVEHNMIPSYPPRGYLFLFWYHPFLPSSRWSSLRFDEPLWLHRLGCVDIGCYRPRVPELEDPGEALDRYVAVMATGGDSYCPLPVSSNNSPNNNFIIRVKITP